MRPIVRDFMTDVAQHVPLLDPVVEIGARPASGQEGFADLRSVFAGHDYVGCDVQDGPGVDRIEDVHALGFEDESVGTVLAADTLEHVADPIRALEEIHRVLRPGGVVAITSVMFFVIHEHPADYWRFTPQGFERLLERFESRLVLSHGYDLLPESVLGVGIKGRSAPLSPEGFPRTAARIGAWGAGSPVDLGPMRLSLRQLWALTMRESVATARRKGGRR